MITDDFSAPIPKKRKGPAPETTRLQPVTTIPNTSPARLSENEFVLPVPKRSKNGAVSSSPRSSFTPAAPAPAEPKQSFKAPPAVKAIVPARPQSLASSSPQLHPSNSKALEKILKFLSVNNTITFFGLLQGPVGCGKSHLLQQEAAKNNMELIVYDVLEPVADNRTWVDKILEKACCRTPDSRGSSRRRLRKLIVFENVDGVFEAGLEDHLGSLKDIAGTRLPDGNKVVLTCNDLNHASLRELVKGKLRGVEHLRLYAPRYLEARSLLSRLKNRLVAWEVELCVTQGRGDFAAMLTQAELARLYRRSFEINNQPYDRAPEVVCAKDASLRGYFDDIRDVLSPHTDRQHKADIIDFDPKLATWGVFENLASTNANRAHMGDQLSLLDTLFCRFDPLPHLETEILSLLVFRAPITQPQASMNFPYALTLDFKAKKEKFLTDALSDPASPRHLLSPARANQIWTRHARFAAVCDNCQCGCDLEEHDK